MPISSLHHSNSTGSSLFAVLSLSTLESLDYDKITALKSVNINTVGDLLHYKPIIYAQILMAFSRREIGHEIDLEHYLDNNYLNTLPSDIPELDIISIEGIGSSTQSIFNNKLGVVCIKELALFPPFIEAQQYLTSDPEVFNEPASAPEYLMPKIIGGIQSIARFNSFFKDEEVKLDNNFSIDIPGGDTLSPIYRIFDRSSRLYVGYVVGFKQKWINMGTHLGEILHSLALAPGESRNIATIEWYRRQSSSRDENTIVDERLSNSYQQSRALNEVVKTTAQEHLVGSTDMEVTTKTSGFGITTGAAGGASFGGTSSVSADVPTNIPIQISGSGSSLISRASSIGGSAVFSKNKQIGTIKSESGGNREVLGQVQQNLNDSTVQNASNIRSLYSTVIVTDEQSEKEDIRTRNVTNYNHSHALTIQYYEVLQKYDIVTALDNWQPILFIPFQPINFNISLIQDYWSLLKYDISENFNELYDKFNLTVENYRSGAFNFNVEDEITVINIGISKISYTGDSPPLGGIHYDSTSGGTGLTANPLNEIELEIINNNGGILVSHIAANSTTYNVNLNLSELNKIQFAFNFHAASGYNLRYPNRSDEYVFEIRFGLKDANGNQLLFEKRFTISKKFHEFDYMGKNNVKEIVLDNVEGGILNDLVNNYNINSSTSIIEIQNHYQLYKYYYTKLLLSFIEEDQLIDIIESIFLSINGNAMALTDYLHPSPIGITENYLLFKPKKIPQDFEDDPIWLYIDKLNKSLNEFKQKSIKKDTVHLPSAGVFAEAILGRSNSSEFVNARRFWNWQDSPIPNLAPQITPIQAGNHVINDNGDILNPTVPASNLNIINPPQYPLTTSLNSALQAVQNGSMFNDMSKSAELINVMGKLADLANNTSQLAGSLSGEAAENALNAAVELGKQVAGMMKDASNTDNKSNIASPPDNPTEKAGALNELEKIKNNKKDNEETDAFDKAAANILGTDLGNSDGKVGESTHSAPDLHPLYDFDRIGGLRDVDGNRFFISSGYVGGERKILYLLENGDNSSIQTTLQPPDMPNGFPIDKYMKPIIHIRSGVGSLIIDTLNRTRCSIRLNEDNDTSPTPELANNTWSSYEYSTPYEKKESETKHPKEAHINLHHNKIQQKSVEDDCDIEEIYISTLLVELLHLRQAQYEDNLWEEYDYPSAPFSIFEYYAKIYGEKSNFTAGSDKKYSISNLQIKARVQYREAKGQTIDKDLFNPIVDAKAYWVGKTNSNGDTIDDAMATEYGIKLNSELQDIFDSAPD